MSRITAPFEVGKHLILFALASAIAFGGCLAVNDSSGDGDADADSDADGEELCDPTGRSLIDTGVYIAPEACTEITLYALEETAENDVWLLAVGWPMYGEYRVLELTNLATGDVETEMLYLGDPEFTLFAGNYILGGFEVAEGDNEIEYKEYLTRETEEGEFYEEVFREGTFTLNVTLSDSVGL